MRHNLKRIQSKLHKTGTYDVCFNDKRYILGDRHNSFAYFHKNIKSQ